MYGQLPARLLSLEAEVFLQLLNLLLLFSQSIMELGEMLLRHNIAHLALQLLQLLQVLRMGQVQSCVGF